MSDGASTTSDGSRSDGGREQAPTQVAVRGGAGGVAALIRATKQQGGGLKDLGKLPVPREVRIERSISAMETSTHSGINPGKDSFIAKFHYHSI